MLNNKFKAVSEAYDKGLTAVGPFLLVAALAAGIWANNQAKEEAGIEGNIHAHAYSYVNAPGAPTPQPK